MRFEGLAAFLERNFVSLCRPWLRGLGSALYVGTLGVAGDVP